MTLFRMACLLLCCALLCCGLPLLSACGKKKPSQEDSPSKDVSASPVEQYGPADPSRISFRKDGDGGSIGVWWWNNGFAKDAEARKKYLSFLARNQVTEIYLCVGDMTDGEIAVFLREAAALGMRVAWLAGDSSWILPEGTGGEKFLREEFLAYQSRVPEELRFYGLHMDVEPHQLPTFWEEKDRLLSLYAAYVERTSFAVRDAGYEIEWDIPFWLDDAQVTVGEDSSPRPLLPFLASQADTLCIMSYRDTATELLSLCREELIAAGNVGCRVVCGVECFSEEGDSVSFAEEGKMVLADQLRRVYTRLSRSAVPAYGVAVHFLQTWFALPVS